MEAPKAKQKDDLEAEAAAAMAELDALTDTNPPTMPPTHHALVLAEQHVALTKTFWGQRTAGEVCTTVGDHDDAKTHFRNAKQTLMRLRALPDVAAARGPEVAVKFAATIAQYEAQEKDPRKLAIVK